MDRDTRLSQRIPGLILRQPRLAYLHAGRLSYTQRLIRFFDGAVQMNQAALYLCPGLITSVVGLMAAHANALRAGTKHRVGGIVNAVIGVANHASWKRKL